MKWNVQEYRDGFRATKTNGLSAYIRRICLWPETKPLQGPGYDISYKGLAIARVYFENKGATVKALAMSGAFPEISDLDLVEIALRLNKLRSAAAAGLN
ncbi:MAG: hypothetical protein A2X28_08525 [Elusimicrobia bacterium GWA2_56_46]|jgi:hypothetical protein|nr:MAG: hypothetical protein A2X28_08525 [Elusimicrobia bacterium GWA2_56_46]OGR55181.1 MAG: hypothetical protein A2X39_01430 [Elusimicrobia bacterium GWC2_56_31]HBB66944.1 hypothetical protein [Elusimicrobiota bacterium]HBW23745.1 hypothetical protein [Elusimicrobiota bacterium]